MKSLLKKRARPHQREGVDAMIWDGLDQGERRRSARQLRADATARAEEDLWMLERDAYGEDRLADHNGVRRGAGGATEVHA
jgi:hypothetical protein